jgi:Secretion system C-terminal sorting domain
MKYFYLLAYASLTLLLSTVSGNLYADPVNPATFNFSTVPVHLTGVYLQPNSTYRFSDVASGTSAIVTIVGTTGGASIDLLDDNNLTKPEAFSPRIIVPANSDGMVEFKIEFYAGNSNNLKPMASLSATAMDIDGTANYLYEKDALNMGAGSVLSYQSNALEINVVQTGNEYLGTNVAGIEYPGVDTTAKQVMFTLTKTNISSFTYKVGVNNLSTDVVSRQKGLYFKGFDYSSLAVRYTNFNASTNDKGIQLNWTTEYERDNDYFEVERSFDGKSFTTIGLVLDAENEVNNYKNYRFKDNASILAQKEVIYYRLKQVDKGGKIAYSTIVAVRLKAKEGIKIQTFPNPFTQKVVIGFTATTTQQAIVKFINASGQTVLTQQTQANKGYNNLTITSVSQLPTGMYVAQLTLNNEVVGSQKIIKQ